MRTKSVADILKLLPDGILEQIGQDTDVDHSVSRLRGDIMVKLLIYSMLRSDRLSLRVLEHFYNSTLFGLFSGKGAHQTRHSSLSSRLTHMNADYFAKLFFWASQHFANIQPKNKLFKQIKRFDSTLCSISSSLVNWGMQVGRPPKEGPAQVQLKFTLGLTNFLPTSVESFFDQEHLSEETALREAIQKADIQPCELVVFDLGLKSCNTLQLFDQQEISFVTRGSAKLRYEVIETNSQIKGRRSDGLRFLQDSKVYLYASGKECIKHPFRLVEAQVEDTGEIISFLTNVYSFNAMDIARIYRRRWDIEVFFRFIKQELNIKHLLNHSENGVAIQIYTALITAILVMAYKVEAKVSGYKIAKLKFEEELLMILMQLSQNKVPPNKKGIAFNSSFSNN